MRNAVVFVLCLVSAGFAIKFPVDDILGRSRTRAEDYKLPRALKPSHYDITLTPKFEDDSFKGTVSIEMEVLEETNQIVLHGNGITFDKEKIVVEKLKENPEDPENPTEINIEGDLKYDELKHFHTITLAETLKVKNVVKITINDYGGTLKNQNKGFYVAEYTDSDGNKKKFATTQFESTSARQAFPCFDEPEWKATFKISIVRPVSYNSVSNMPLEDTKKTKEGETATDMFQVSVPMSTYLVAFVVSEMKAETGETNEIRERAEDVAYSVYGIPHLIDEGRGKYARENGIKVIDAMESFVDVKYSDYIKKLDQVAIPDEYFSAGAMENWGLVTYKQRYLLVKGGVTTASERQNVLSIIAHEFAHQWFGNVVSPMWWNVVWLSEGFATYFEHYATDVVDPSMKMMDQFVTLTTQVAFESDSSDVTRPMTSQVGSPEDISASFDRIAYQKAGAVIRMMEHIVTTDVFKKGLNKYLTSKDKGSVVPSDLWTAMQNIIDTLEGVDIPPLNGKPVEEIMETWNSNEGYPVVTLSRNEEGIVSLSQDRFLLNKTASGDDTLWSIPINYAVEEDEPNFEETTAEYWLTKKEDVTEIQVDLDKWIILNKQQTGFYRVNYDQKTWNLIIDYLNSDNYEKIHLLNRAQLIDDSFNLARSGRLGYDIPMRLCRYLAKEKEYVPLATFLKSVQFMDAHLASSDNYKHFKAYVNEQLQGAYKELGNEDTDKHVDKLNRANVISWLCKFQDEKCTAAMHTKLIAVAPPSSAEDGPSVEPDLQNAVYCGGNRIADHAEHKLQNLYALYTSDNVEYLEKARVLAGMGCSSSEDVLNKLMNAALGKEEGFTIAEGDKVAAFSAVYTSGTLGVDKAVNFVVNNFADVAGAFTTAQLQTILRGIATRTSSQNHLDKLNTIKDAPEGTEEILQGIKETIEWNIQWAETNLEKLDAWLGEYGSASFASISLSLLFGMLAILTLF